MEHAAAVGEIPESGVVTAELAESALGRTMATELDQDMLDAVDADTKKEEDMAVVVIYNIHGFMK